MTRPGEGKGYMPVDHSNAIEKMGGQLSDALRAGWLPKSPTAGFSGPRASFPLRDTWTGWRAKAMGRPPDFLSHSHGEGFLRFFEERCQRRVSSSSTNRNSRCRPAPDRIFQADAANGGLPQLPDHHGHAFAHADGLSQRAVAAAVQVWAGTGHRQQTDHYKIMRRECADPAGFVEAVMEELDDTAS